MLKNSMLILTLAMSQPVFAASLEVLHWWTAEGEVQSQLILKKALAEKDIKWQSFAITGEGEIVPYACYKCVHYRVPPPMQHR
ncbi:hypothetical protein [Psychromonas sp. MME1]|uniref:hypothetical protein n=1 Tax=Psychromonas sp. MME1 TaxID=3231032 RepID=UPI0034E2CC10